MPAGRSLSCVSTLHGGPRHTRICHPLTWKWPEGVTASAPQRWVIPRTHAGGVAREASKYHSRPVPATRSEAGEGSSIADGARLAAGAVGKGRHTANLVSVHSNEVEVLCFDAVLQVFILKELLIFWETIHLPRSEEVEKGTLRRYAEVDLADWMRFTLLSLGTSGRTFLQGV